MLSKEDLQKKRNWTTVFFNSVNSNENSLEFKPFMSWLPKKANYFDDIPLTFRQYKEIAFNKEMKNDNWISMH